MGFFSAKKSSNYLGVDIGASSIKIVELKNENGRAVLVNYGFSDNDFEGLSKEWRQNKKLVAAIIKKIWKESGMTSKNVVTAIPTFSVFSSILNLYDVSEKNIEAAVMREAKKVVGLPLEEMALDWKKVELGEEESFGSGKNLKVLLTGAPKNLIKDYVDVFNMAGFNLLGLETEFFSLKRALIGNDNSIIMIVEIGSNTTDISIIKSGIPLLSRSIDVGGRIITEIISKKMGIERKDARQFKHDLSFAYNNLRFEDLPLDIKNAISPIVNEIEYTTNLFQKKNNTPIEKIIFSGGASMFVNIADYVSARLNKKVIVGDPWFRVFCPVNIEHALKEVGPKMSIAIGLALREIDEE